MSTVVNTLNVFDALVKRSREQMESVVYDRDKFLLVEENICIDDFKDILLADSILLNSDVIYDNRSGSTSSNIDVGPADDDDDGGLSNSNLISCRDRLRTTAWKRCLNVDTCSSEEGSDVYLSLTKVCMSSRFSLITSLSIIHDSALFVSFLLGIISRRLRYMKLRSRMTLSVPSKGMMFSGIKLKMKVLSFEYLQLCQINTDMYKG